MGYFSNGREGHEYEALWCNRCVHQGPDEGPGCSVWMLHLLWNYEQHDDSTKQRALGTLIPRSDDGLRNERCKMFHTKGRCDE